jgi:hypothetical protein
MNTEFRAKSQPENYLFGQSLKLILVLREKAGFFHNHSFKILFCVHLAEASLKLKDKFEHQRI